jgi:hypothetical protein
VLQVEKGIPGWVAGSHHDNPRAAEAESTAAAPTRPFPVRRRWPTVPACGNDGSSRPAGGYVKCPSRHVRPHQVAYALC